MPPANFVSLLEETGMILAAGRWALRKAVEDIRRWQALGLKVPRTSVNVSALQLRQKDFVDSVLDALSQFEGETPLLDLEITESVLVDDIDESTRKLQALRRAGVEVSVDDFGTGFCSLSYLARLPVDTLKIDRSFVVRMRDAGYPRNIVAMIVSLAHTLGLRVVAEGVEDDEQVRLLRELGCDQIQGFFVSRPVPAEQIVPLLRGLSSSASPPPERRASGHRTLMAYGKTAPCGYSPAWRAATVPSPNYTLRRTHTPRFSASRRCHAHGSGDRQAQAAGTIMKSCSEFSWWKTTRTLQSPCVACWISAVTWSL